MRGCGATCVIRYSPRKKMEWYHGLALAMGGAALLMVCVLYGLIYVDKPWRADINSHAILQADGDTLVWNDRTVALNPQVSHLEGKKLAVINTAGVLDVAANGDVIAEDVGLVLNRMSIRPPSALEQ